MGLFCQAGRCETMWKAAPISALTSRKKATTMSISSTRSVRRSASWPMSTAGVTL